MNKFTIPEESGLSWAGVEVEVMAINNELVQVSTDSSKNADF